MLRSKIQQYEQQVDTLQKQVASLMDPCVELVSIFSIIKLFVKYNIQEEEASVALVKLLVQVLEKNKLKSNTFMFRFLQQQLICLNTVRKTTKYLNDKFSKKRKS